jgi:hypothetical protein
VRTIKERDREKELRMKKKCKNGEEQVDKQSSEEVVGTDDRWLVLSTSRFINRKKVSAVSSSAGKAALDHYTPPRSTAFVNFFSKEGREK